MEKEVGEMFVMGVFERAAIAGVLGFALSLYLGIAKLWAGRLRIKLENINFATSKNNNDRVFFVILTLTNKSSNPFSLVSLSVNEPPRNASISPVVYSYNDRIVDVGTFQVEFVKLSTRFPVRFDSYASHEIFCTIDCPQILQTLRNFHPLPTRGRWEYLRKLCHRIRKSNTHQPRIRLVFHTSKGRRAIYLSKYFRGLHDFEWLREYAVQKAIHEGKIIYPS